MKITFDVAKRDATLAERGLDFADADEVMSGPAINMRDDRFDYGEERWITIGYLKRRMVVVVWMERDGGRRIISMRKANVREQQFYGVQLD